MSILKVARMGHPVLRQRGRPLEKHDLRSPLVQKLIDDMAVLRELIQATPDDGARYHDLARGWGLLTAAACIDFERRAL